MFTCNVYLRIPLLLGLIIILCKSLKIICHTYNVLLYTTTGRTIRIRVFDPSRVSEFLTNAVEAAFDWVSYENSNYVRLSVMPDSKLSMKALL